MKKKEKNIFKKLLTNDLKYGIIYLESGNNKNKGEILWKRNKF